MLILGLVSALWIGQFVDPDSLFDWNFGIDLISAHFVQIIVGLLYFVAFESSTLQATPGKLLCGLKVTDLSGARLHPPRAVGRYIAKALLLIFFSFGYLFAMFTQKKQALHDLIAGTIVLYRH
jgi:uncharacterized RDD family membrane protein YckC